MDCWASSLGGCGGGLSREHILSKNQFDSDTVTVKGFSWCREGKTIGLGSLVAKNLCRDLFANVTLSARIVSGLQLAARGALRAGWAFDGGKQQDGGIEGFGERFHGTVSVDYGGSLSWVFNWN